MAVELVHLPQLCLEEIFKELSYSEISQLGTVCRYFREISKTMFRVYFRHQEEIIEREMEKIENEATKSEKLTVDDHVYLALLHSVLRILLSETKMLKAHCWRYMRDPSYDFCFPAGKILDEFERILKSVREKSLRKDMEPEISTTLFHLGEKFYDYFDAKIETSFRDPPGMQLKIVSKTNRQTHLPKIYIVSSSTEQDTRYNMKEPIDKEMKEKTLFGVKIMDILDCCATSDFHSWLCYNTDMEGFQINTEYKLTDVNVLQALPSTGLAFSTVQRQLNKICRYVRNNVRWTNLFHPLQDLWMLEDAIEINRNVHTASALLRQWQMQRTSSRLTMENAQDIPHYNYRRIVSRFKNCFSLVVSANLECPNKDNMPLKLQKYIDANKVKTVCSIIQNMSCEDVLKNGVFNNLNEGVTIYKFNLELKIQYPSFLTDKVQEAVLRVDQVGDETVVTSNGDQIIKSATFRADEGNYDDKYL